MEEQEIFQRLEKIAREKLEVNEKTKITLDTDLRKDLEMDSLDGYELLYTVEEEFGISIPDQKALEINTFRDATNYIRMRKDKNYTPEKLKETEKIDFESRDDMIQRYGNSPILQDDYYDEE
ncbi:MAG: acyl carrier protein [Candidatus Pacearchaeota archaeon]|jgi:acyl carrier protein